MPVYNKEKQAFHKAVTKRFLRTVDGAILAGYAETYADLCREIGLEKTRLSEMQSGKSFVTLYSIYRLSRLLGISTDEIISKKGAKTK